MSANENIKNKFLNFEAEASPEAIEQSWERIKYFLPQEKKRRFVFFIKRTGVALVFLFLIGTVTLTYLVNKRSEPIAEHRVKNSRNVPEKNSSLSPALIDVENKKLLTAAKKVDEMPDQNPQGFKNLKDFNSTNGFQNQDVAKESDPNKNNMAVKEGNHSIGDLSIVSSSLEQDSIPFVVMELVTINKIENETVNELRVKNNPEKLLKEPWKNTISVDLLSGINRFATEINSKQITGTNYVIGAGINYQINSRLFVSGQVVLIGKEAVLQTTETNNILVQKQHTNTAITGIIPDTLITYRKVHTDKKFETRQSYNIAIGGGCRVFRGNKFSVNAVVLANMRVTEYKYSTKNKFDPDLYYVIKSNGSAPFTNYIREAPSEITETKQLRTFGFTPGLLLTYDIRPRVSFIVKPMYQFDLSDKKIFFNSATFNQRQNNLFLFGGLRIIL
jgi:hypothetical protein